METKRRPGRPAVAPESATVRMPLGTLVRIERQAPGAMGEYLRQAILQRLDRDERLLDAKACSGRIDAAE